MKKLLLASVAVLVLADTAQAENIAPFHGTMDFGRGPVTIKEVTYDGSSRVVSARDTDGNLYTRNEAWMRGAPANVPHKFVFYATPKGQLPACNSAEVVTILARITNRTLNSVLDPTTIGSGPSKNFCTAAFALRGSRNYTVEWMNPAEGTYWVQIQ